jgi:tRNA/tmRNA/rRNA uracil-C5-methylase (TrmA/RlmC/RlmD family)
MKKIIDNKIKKNGSTRTRNSLVRGQIAECQIDSLNHEGFGFGFAEGLPLLVKGALPGELARVRVTFAGQRETFAEVLRS